MFRGIYFHSVDQKGRIIVPAKYREQLGYKFFITKGFDHCLYIFPTDEWLKFEEKLSKLPVSKKETRKLVRFFLSSAYEAELDKQGRVLLQQDHRGFADIAGDVVLAGVGSKIEIWSKEKWEESALYGDNDEVGQDMDDFDIEF